MAAGDTDGSGLAINRNMAQAFEVPKGSWTAGGTNPTMFSPGAIDQPRTNSRSPLPAWPILWIDSENMGPSSFRCKLADTDRNLPIPGSAESEG